MSLDKKTLIGVVGGTGKLGFALARRWAKAGYPVIIGSRTEEKARAVAAELSAELGQQIDSAANPEAAARASLVVVTVPYSAQAETLHEIRANVLGKIVVDTTVPLQPPKVMRVQLPEEGSAAKCALAVLGEDVRLVSAFHSVAAHKLATDAEIACDVMVFGDDKDARAAVVQLADDAGLRGIHAGALCNAVAAEALTSILIFVNKTYAVDGAGIQFTGDLIIPREDV